MWLGRNQQGAAMNARDDRLAGLHPAAKAVIKIIDDLQAAQSERDALKAACEAWMQVESEMADKHPCPDLALRADYRKRAVALTETALALTKKQEGE
jgi:hypothetical protein